MTGVQTCALPIYIPFHLIVEISKRLPPNGAETLDIPIGSGETALAFAIRHPDLIDKVRLYRDGTPATAYDEGATLNPIINAIYRTDVSKI